FRAEYLGRYETVWPGSRLLRIVTTFSSSREQNLAVLKQARGQEVAGLVGQRRNRRKCAAEGLGRGVVDLRVAVVSEILLIRRDPSGDHHPAVLQNGGGVKGARIRHRSSCGEGPGLGVVNVGAVEQVVVLIQSAGD